MDHIQLDVLILYYFKQGSVDYQLGVFRSGRKMKYVKKLASLIHPELKVLSEL